jgi:hypothetical protein
MAAKTAAKPKPKAKPSQQQVKMGKMAQLMNAKVASTGSGPSKSNPKEK